MNQALYQTLLTPQFQLHLPKTRADAAEAMANAYHLSNIGQTTTPFGAPLLNADKTILKTFIQLSLDINFFGGQVQSTVSQVIQTIRGAISAAESGLKDAVKIAQKQVNSIIDGLVSALPAPLTFLSPILKNLVGGIFKDLLSTVGNALGDVYKCMKKLQGLVDLLDVSKIAYLVMSTGYCLYWLTASMAPVPPMPPCIGPSGGTIILLPGLPTPLNSDLAKTFTKGNTVLQAVGKLYNSLITHQLTVAGIYLGIIPFFPSPIPGPPIPWFSMLSIPFPSINLPGILGGKDSKGAEKQKQKQDAIAKDPDGESKKAGDKLKGALDGLRKQAGDLAKC
jgi:hypothetical protein